MVIWPSECISRCGSTPLQVISAEMKDLDDTAPSSLASKFETNGVLVFPGAVSLDDVNVLSISNKVDESTSSSTSNYEVSDFADETKAAKRRIHKALPLLGCLLPLFALILQCNSSEDVITLIGSGFIQTSYHDANE